MVRSRVPKRTVELEEVANFLEWKGAGELVEELVTVTEPRPQNGAREKKLVTLQEASEMFKISFYTLDSWVRRSHSVVRDKERYPGPGGARRLVDPDDVRELKLHPPKGGPRPKT